MKVKFGMLVAALAVVAFGWVGGQTSNAGPAEGTVALKFDLRGPEISEVVPRGTMRYTSSAFDDRILLTVSRVMVDQGTVFTARVNSTVIGTITINANHRGRLFLSEDEGDAVPDVVSGDNVTLWYDDDGDEADPEVEDPTPQVVGLRKPTDPKFFYMFTKMTGPAIDGRVPLARATYKETEFGYARTLRVFIQSIRLQGEVLHLVRRVGATDTEMGTCTVTAAKQCLIKLTIHDDDPVTDLTTSSVLKVLDDDDEIILSHTGWTQVLPPPGN
jgi:hypothetical protein